MSSRVMMRTSAVLDGVTSIARVPTINSVSHRRPHIYWSRQSDIAKSWTFVGKYLAIALQDHEAETQRAHERRRADDRD